MQLDAVCELIGTTAQTVFTGQPHALEADARWRRTARRRGVSGLAPEILFSREERRRQNLDEHTRAPALLRISAAMTGESASERLDEQRERVAFVPVIEAAGWQERARRRREECVGIIRRQTGRIDRPRAREFFLFGARSIS